jgi:predicted aldo/keto reductase-like oxidoreductase
MSSQYRMGRRKFLMTSAGVVTAGLGTACGHAASTQEIQEAAAKVGQLPRRRLGKSDREVSVLIGAGDWASEAVEAGILCGINYWHKADDWGETVPQAILKNRDAHYCEVCVDRVRGNHETGVLDEETHYQWVRQTLQRSRLGYFDDLMFHFGYHSVAEVKNNRAFIRLYERLKKEGLVRHLCLSQHNYLGNRRVPGGETTQDILTAVMEEGLFEHAQFAFTYGDSEPMKAFVSLAKRKGFGTTGMKTTRGASRMEADRSFMKNFPAGTTTHHALARWLTTQSQLDTAVISIGSLREFVDTYSGAGKAMRAADVEAIEQMTAYANREVCRLCNECMSHCDRGIQIADILRYERYARDYGARDHARRLYAQLEAQGDACNACGACLPHCPQGLRIQEKLAQTHRLLA